MNTDKVSGIKDYFVSVVVLLICVLMSYYAQPVLDYYTGYYIYNLVVLFFLLTAFKIYAIQLLCDKDSLDTLLDWKKSLKYQEILLKELRKQVSHLYIGIVVTIYFCTLALIPENFRDFTDMFVLFLGSLYLLGTFKTIYLIHKLHEKRMLFQLEDLMLKEGVPKSKILEMRK